MTLGLIIELEGTLKNMKAINFPSSIAEPDRDRSFTVLFMEFSLKIHGILLKKISVNDE